MAIDQSSRSCTYTLFLSFSKLAYFHSYGQQFLTYRPIFKIAIFGHETWPPNWAFSFYGQCFLRHNNWLIFEIAIFGNETSTLAKVPEVAYTVKPVFKTTWEIGTTWELRTVIPRFHCILSFYPRGVETELIFTLWSTVREIEQLFYLN